MTKARRLAPSITDEEEARIQAGIASDPDNPELTDAQLAGMRPAREVLPPTLFEALTVSGQDEPVAARVRLTLVLDAGVVDAYQASGTGWQQRMNEVLAEGAAQLRKKRL